ncbi:MAG: sporulation protein [Nitriliruptorales bacterium]|nr:sporulation protein [Nitriliruptorales bacterium]
MNPIQWVENVREVLTVQRVFGEPIERDGVTVIPVAAIGGGGGGGSQPADAGNEAGGGGFGMGGRPVGVYVVADGKVTWQPAFDLTRVAVMGQIVALGIVLVLRRLVLRRSKRRR